jgi:hypothetical protein
MDYFLPMLRIAFLPLLLAAALLPARANSVPRGQVAELHSCEVYAGGCVVSAEATIAGHYVMRAWQFESGRFQGVELRGLHVALLETGSLNLADKSNPAERAVAYVPQGISATQRAALVAWARQNTAAPLQDANIKSVPIQMQVAGNSLTVSLRPDVVFSGATAPACGLGSCGESLWYQPRSEMSAFAVDQLTRSRIVEPTLALQWQDHGRRTLFLGRFGDPAPSNPTGLCGAPADGGKFGS